MVQCPCGSGSELAACCGPFLDGAPAPTAEALMRSRFTAFVHGDLDYVESTHASAVRDSFNRSSAESMLETGKWVRLEVRDVAGGGVDDDAGTVEFVAHFRKGKDALVHHERSNFRRENGRWVYVDGKMNPKDAPRRVEKVGRNDPCPCGSGRKFKKCCGE